MSIDLVKENGLILQKAASRKYPTETIMDADYPDNLVLLANATAQAESGSLELPARDIGLYVNPDKTKFRCFNQDRAISTLNSKLLKLVDHFTYHRSIYRKKC